MRFLRQFLTVVLAFLSVSAFWGGAKLIVDAHGNPWGMMPLSLLRFSPFHSWLIPGILLLVANGLLALWVLWLVLAQRPAYGLWVALQGFVLLGWLIVECATLRFVVWPHYFYGALALALIVAGFALRHEPSHAPA